jgi:hypothetical protein
MNNTILEKFLRDDDCKENLINNPNLLSQVIKFKGPKNQNILHLICKSPGNESLVREVLSTKAGRMLLLQENEGHETPIYVPLYYRESRYFNLMIATQEGKRAFKMMPNAIVCKIFKLNKPTAIIISAVKRHINKFGITFNPSGSFSRFINRYSANIDSSFLGEDTEISRQLEIDKVLNKICDSMSKRH